MQPFALLRRYFCTVLISAVCCFAHAKPIPKDLWSHWQENNPTSSATINHSPWQTILSKYVSTNKEGINVVDYAHMGRREVNLLNDYFFQLSHIELNNYNRNEQLAFWINLYNAGIVKTVLAHYPVESINEINSSPGMLMSGPWKASLLKIKGVKVTLYDIAHRILRPIWKLQEYYLP